MLEPSEDLPGTYLMRVRQKNTNMAYIGIDKKPRVSFFVILFQYAENMLLKGNQGAFAIKINQIGIESAL